MKVPQKLLEQLLIDPVMASYVILKMELDTFQAARLRTYWWVPNVQDNSGVSTGKTAVDFAYVCLRAIFCGRLSNHIAAVYFPNFQTMKDEFWPYFDRTIEASDIFRSLLKIHNGKVGEHKDPGAWWMEFKDGSRIVCPAPGFLNDSMTQASRRFNTLVVDDYLRAMDMGEGIEKQLIDRVTRPCFNQEHPIWSNHTKLLGHAEKPSHRGYVRYKAASFPIRSNADGSRRYSRAMRPHMGMASSAGITFRSSNAAQLPCFTSLATFVIRSGSEALEMSSATASKRQRSINRRFMGSGGLESQLHHWCYRLRRDSSLFAVGRCEPNRK